MDPNITHPYAGTVSAAVIEPLRRTKGWARFLSVLGFIGSGIMILAGIGMIVASVAGGMMSGSRAALFGGVPFGAMGALYIVLSLIYLVPAFWLGRYASRIGELMQRQTELDLIATLDAQRSFWKFVGVFTLVILSIYAVGFIVMMIALGVGVSNL